MTDVPYVVQLVGGELFLGEKPKSPKAFGVGGVPCIDLQLDGDVSRGLEVFGHVLGESNVVLLEYIGLHPELVVACEKTFLETAILPNAELLLRSEATMVFFQKDSLAE